MKAFCVLILLAAVWLAGCAANQAPATAANPSDVLKQYVAASQRGDIQTMKSLLSKGSADFMERYVKAENEKNPNVPKRTIDDILRAETEVKLSSEVETRNEKIEGETATVEVKNPTTGEFDVRYPFVRENGAWKLARDRYIEEELRIKN